MAACIPVPMGNMSISAKIGNVNGTSLTYSNVMSGVCIPGQLISTELKDHSIKALCNNKVAGHNIHKSQDCDKNTVVETLTGINLDITFDGDQCSTASADNPICEYATKTIISHENVTDCKSKNSGASQVTTEFIQLNNCNDDGGSKSIAQCSLVPGIRLSVQECPGGCILDEIGNGHPKRIELLKEDDDSEDGGMVCKLAATGTTDADGKVIKVGGTKLSSRSGISYRNGCDNWNGKIKTILITGCPKATIDAGRQVSLRGLSAVLLLAVLYSLLSAM